MRVPLRFLTELRNNIVSKPARAPAEQAARREAASSAVRENAENLAVVERIAAGSMASALEAPSLAALSGQCPSSHQLHVIIILEGLCLQRGVQTHHPHHFTIYRKGLKLFKPTQ